MKHSSNKMKSKSLVLYSNYFGIFKNNVISFIQKIVFLQIKLIQLLLIVDIKHLAEFNGNYCSLEF